MKILDLPWELLELIICWTQRSDINTLSQTCQDLFIRLVPWLYSHHINPRDISRAIEGNLVQTIKKALHFRIGVFEMHHIRLAARLATPDCAIMKMLKRSRASLDNLPTFRANEENEREQLELCLASRQGEYDVVKGLIDFGLPVDGPNIPFEHRLDGLFPPLHEAIYAGHLSVIKLLLQRGANIDMRGEEGDTPLILAVKIERYEIMRLLVRHGADIEATCPRHWTALSTAVGRSDPIATGILLRAGANPNASNAHKLNCPIKIALKDGYIGILEDLFRHGARIDFVGSEDLELHILVSQKRWDCFKFCLDKVPNLDTKDGTGRTALYLAVQLRKPDIVRSLAERGANVTVRIAGGWTPVMMAASLDSYDMVRDLVSYGAHLHDVNEVGKNIIHVTNDARIIQLAIDAGVDLNGLDRYERTPLHSAQGSKVYLLLDQGADPLIVSADGMTAHESHVRQRKKRTEQRKLRPPVLHQHQLTPDGGLDRALPPARGLETPLELMLNAAYWGDDALLRQSILEGHDIEQTDDNGATPLLLGIEVLSMDTIRLLLDHGADVNRKDAVGNSALSVAFELGDFMFMTLLFQRGADVDYQTLDGKTLLMMSCAETTGVASMSLEKMKWLLLCGADITLADETGKTALHWAAACESPMFAKLLLQAGAVPVLAKNGRSPLFTGIESYVAARSGQWNNTRSKKTLNLLLDHGLQMSQADTISFNALTRGLDSPRAEEVHEMLRLRSQEYMPASLQVAMSNMFREDGEVETEE